MSIASDGAWAADTMPNELDGFNVWEALTTGKESPRTELELVHNYYIRVRPGDPPSESGEWKLITGQVNQQWFPPSGSASHAAPMKKVQQRCGNSPTPYTAATTTSPRLGLATAIQRQKLECSAVGPEEREVATTSFVLQTDPDETTNLLNAEPERVASLRAKLDVFRAAEAACSTCGSNDPAAEVEAAKTGFWLAWKGVKPMKPVKPGNLKPAPTELLPSTKAERSSSSSDATAGGAAKQTTMGRQHLQRRGRWSSCLYWWPLVGQLPWRPSSLGADLSVA